jgi:Family of unknown function (DUF5850)
MLDNKIFFTFIAMVLAIFSISKSKLSPNLIENFVGMPPVKVSLQRVVAAKNGQMTSTGLLDSNPLGFVSSPNFQATISPRCYGGDYNASIKYSMPALANLAVPQNPMSYNNNGNMANMAKETYTRENYGCTTGNCGASSASSGSGSTQLKSISASKATETGNNLPTSMVAMQDMTTVDVQGNAQQVHVFDNYIYANAKSRLRGQSDQIRGDLPIVPCKKGNFDVSINLNTDLNAGALAAMGGVAPGTSAFDTAKLIYAASGNTNDTLSGVNMSNTFATLGSQYAQMNVSSFS